MLKSRLLFKPSFEIMVMILCITFELQENFRFASYQNEAGNLAALIAPANKFRKKFVLLPDSHRCFKKLRVKRFALNK